MATEPKANPALVQYEQIILRTREMDREGLLDSPAAAELTEEWNALWDQLSAQEQAIIDGLSGDLYMLDDEEIYHPGRLAEVSPQEVWYEAQYAFQEQDWTRLLEVLRSGLTDLSPQSVAMLRGVAYEALGLRVASQRFTQYAKDIIAKDEAAQQAGKSAQNGL
jgi:hypothetical protein